MSFCRSFAIILMVLLFQQHAVLANDGIRPIPGTQSPGKPYSVSRTPDGGLRFEVRPFDNVAAIGDGGKAIERSEKVVGESVFDHTMEARWTFTWTQTKGEPLPLPKYRWLSISQWHVPLEPGDLAMSPPIMFDVIDGVLNICRRTTMERPWKRIPPPVCLKKPLEQGRAYKIVHQVKFTRAVAGGTHRVWLDGEEIDHYTGPLGYRANKPPYMKIGIYRSHTNDIDTVTYRDVSLKMID